MSHNSPNMRGAKRRNPGIAVGSKDLGSWIAAVEILQSIILRHIIFNKVFLPTYQEDTGQRKTGVEELKSKFPNRQSIAYVEPGVVLH